MRDGFRSDKAPVTAPADPPESLRSELISQVGPLALRRATQDDTAKATSGNPAADLQKLSATKDIAGLRRFALEVQDYVLATKAVQQIITNKPGNMPDILGEAVRSDSYAVGPSIIGLALTSRNSQDLQPILGRIKNGDLDRLLKEGKVTGFDLAWLMSENSVLEKFPALRQEFMKALKTSPELMTAMYTAFLQTSTFQTWSMPAVSDSQRLEALDYLLAKQPKGYERTVALAALAGKPPLSSQIEKTLTEHWTTMQRQPAGELSVSELLSGKSIQKLAEFEGHRWPDGREDTPALYKKWSELQKAIDKIDGAVDDYLKSKGIEKRPTDPEIQKLLADNPALLEIYKKAQGLKPMASELRADLDTTKAKREAIMNQVIPAKLKELGIQLPEFNIKLLSHEHKESTLGNYRQGHIGLREELVMTSNHFGPEVFGTVLHELVHHEQNKLMIRAVVDQVELERRKQEGNANFRITAESDPSIKAEIKKRYEQLGIEKLPDALLDSVLAIRTGPLSEGEKKRADLLIKSNHDAGVSGTIHIDAVVTKLNKALALFGDESFSFEFGPDGSEKAMNLVKKALDVDKLPDRLVMDFKRLEQAEKDKVPDTRALQSVLRMHLIEALQTRKAELEKKGEHAYRTSFHEDEAFQLERIATYFALVSERGRIGKNIVSLLPMLE